MPFIPGISISIRIVSGLCFPTSESISSAEEQVHTTEKPGLSSINCNKLSRKISLSSHKATLMSDIIRKYKFIERSQSYIHLMGADRLTTVPLAEDVISKAPSINSARLCLFFKPLLPVCLSLLNPHPLSRMFNERRDEEIYKLIEAAVAFECFRML